MRRSTTIAVGVASGAIVITTLAVLRDDGGGDEAPPVPTVNITATEPRRAEPSPSATAVPTSSPPASTTPGLATATPPAVSPLPTEPRVAPTGTAVGRLAPDAESPPLSFRQIVIVSEGGTFAGRANVTNAGASFLNAISFEWRILGESGGELAGGTASWPNLAPGETATVTFWGSTAYTESWREVRFRVLP